MIKRWVPRDPFSGASHLGGAGLSVGGLVVLMGAAEGKPWHLTSFAIYGASLILLYCASGLYHSLHVTPHRLEKLRAFDMVAIYFLIAGTYTPVCLISLRGSSGWILLGTVWGIALGGAAARIAWRGMPDWLSLALYLVMGWLAVGVISPLVQALPPPAIAWLLAGGVCYSVGAAVYATERPRLWPGAFGAHDLWHVFVLAGSACHFVMILVFVAPAP